MNFSKNMIFLFFLELIGLNFSLSAHQDCKKIHLNADHMTHINQNNGDIQNEERYDPPLRKMIGDLYCNVESLIRDERNKEEIFYKSTIQEQKELLASREEELIKLENYKKEAKITIQTRNSELNSIQESSNSLKKEKDELRTKCNQQYVLLKKLEDESKGKDDEINSLLEIKTEFERKEKEYFFQIKTLTEELKKVRIESGNLRLSCKSLKEEQKSTNTLYKEICSDQGILKYLERKHPVHTLKSSSYQNGQFLALDAIYRNSMNIENNELNNYINIITNLFIENEKEVFDLHNTEDKEIFAIYGIFFLSKKSQFIQTNPDVIGFFETLCANTVLTLQENQIDPQSLKIELDKEKQAFQIFQKAYISFLDDQETDFQEEKI